MLIHAVRTRRTTSRFFILLFGSDIGVLAYLVLEMLPGWRGASRQGGQERESFALAAKLRRELD